MAPSSEQPATNPQQPATNPHAATTLDPVTNPPAATTLDPVPPVTTADSPVHPNRAPECPVCLGDLEGEAAAEAVTLRCGHTMHVQCWLPIVMMVQDRMKRDSGCKRYSGLVFTEWAACLTLSSWSMSRIDPDRRIPLTGRPVGLRGIPFARRGRGERRRGSDGEATIAFVVWDRRIGGDGSPRNSPFSAASIWNRVWPAAGLSVCLSLALSPVIAELTETARGKRSESAAPIAGQTIATRPGRGSR